MKEEDFSSLTLTENGPHRRDGAVGKEKAGREAVEGAWVGGHLLSLSVSQRSKSCVWV